MNEQELEEYLKEIEFKKKQQKQRQLEERRKKNELVKKSYRLSPTKKK